MKCNKHVGDCDCPDIQERLSGLGGAGTNTAVKVCRKCEQHYARCKCPEPDFFVRIEGEEVPVDSVVALSETVAIRQEEIDSWQ